MHIFNIIQLHFVLIYFTLTPVMYYWPIIT